VTDHTEELENLLGGKLERKDSRVIPGTVAVAGFEFIYFSDVGKNSPRDQFWNITGKADPPHLRDGDAHKRGGIIKILDGLSFHTMGYLGDLPGWRKQIAQELNLLTATIKGNRFVISDGREFPLSECWSNSVDLHPLPRQRVARARAGGAPAARSRDMK